MIPLKYNLRNLRARWVNTLLSVIATGLVVLVMVVFFGFIDGLEHALSVSGDPLDVLVLRKGSNSETGSTVESQQAKEIATLSGIARDSENNPFCSSEFVTILTKPRRNKGGTTNLIVRGLDQIGRGLRPDFKIVEGRDLKPGLNEAITSRSMAKRFENLGLNEEIMINKSPFKVVGYFEAGGSAAESEVWTDFRNLTAARNTPSAISVVNLRAQDEASLTNLIETLENDKRFLLKAQRETKYFEDQMTSALGLKIFALFLGVLFSIGAMFAVANTMYSAVANRAREIGTLRALGFSQGSILVSFLSESVCLCGIGAILGCLGTLPLTGYSTGTTGASFSEVMFTFRFGPNVMMLGAGMALSMGLVGGFFPALSAVRMKIVDALRKS